MKIFKELLPYIIIIAIVVLIRTFLLTPVRVNGTSMAPTLENNEVLLLNKVKKLNRLDIVVIDTKDERLIKRIIGIPGETIEIKEGKIIIDDLVLDDTFGFGTTSDLELLTLGEGEYFVLGDNREDSKDSRFFGPFSKRQIEGTTSFVIFPFKSFGKVK